MKKTFFAVLISGLFITTGLKSQTIQDGMNHLYADRFQSAADIFQKLLAVNPNNTEATYWLGQTYLDMDDNAAARQLYEKALMASANSPLLLVGMGHVNLLDKKTDDARQKFEAAITMTHTKKGDDPVILNAIGRANIDAKAGDLAYAIDKLKAAVERDPKNPDIFLNLGNAYRKAKPGEGGGDAYTSYMKALEVNPNFAYAYVRIASLFESQKNWDLVLENLNKAVEKDPGFSLAYKDLFDYYYWVKYDYTEAETYLNKYIQSKLPEKEIDDDYMYAQLCYLKKDYDCVITKDQNVINTMGSRTKPKVYKAMAYAYLDKRDTVNAKKYVDDYFAKESPEKVVPLDYVLKANVYSAGSSNIDSVVKAYVDASNADTTITGKIDWLKKGAELMKSRGNRAKEAELREIVFKTKPIPSNLDIFNWGLALYFDSAYAKADSVITIYTTKYPDEPAGLNMQFNIERQMDTSMEKGLAVPIATKYLEILQKDTLKNKSNIISVAGYLAQYYANIAKDRDKSLEYLRLMLQMDPNNETIKKYLDDMEKPPKQNNSKGGTTSKPNGKLNMNKNQMNTKNSFAKR